MLCHQRCLRCSTLLVGDAAVVDAGRGARTTSEPIVARAWQLSRLRVRYPVPEVAPPPVLRNGWLTFGSFASAHKITDPVVAAWSRILLGAPTARLLLRGRTLDDPSNRAGAAGAFARYGVAPDRLIAARRGRAFRLPARLRRGSISRLDTFPYNGGTTTTEALWQGVPVLTFNGDRWASRTSRSLLLAAGLSEWVATDVADFVSRACRAGSAG